jgi:hypothetical protein
MSQCRSGCKTQNHRSYAACLQAANVTIAATVTSSANFLYDKTKKDLSAYQTARLNGIQPEGTTVEKVRAAEDASRLLGRAYNAEKDPPANMIVNKNTAKFVNVTGD